MSVTPLYETDNEDDGAANVPFDAQRKSSNARKTNLAQRQSRTNRSQEPRILAVSSEKSSTVNLKGMLRKSKVEDALATTFTPLKSNKSDEEFEAEVADYKRKQRSKSGARDDNKAHGTGTLKFANYQFEGQYVVRKHGRGKAMWTDGSKYDGEWYENKIQGFGTMVWPDGRMYQGEWFHNEMTGIGLYSWHDGRKFVGEYKAGEKQGYGIYKFANGALHLGYWVDGKGAGLGAYQRGDTRIKYGLWEDGQ